MAIINLEMIGQMIADHDRDRRSQDFEKVIMSDCGSQFGKMIVSDRGSQKVIEPITGIHRPDTILFIIIFFFQTGMVATS